MAKTAKCFAILVALTLCTAALFASEPEADVTWLNDYAQAMKEAKQSQKILCILFYDQTGQAARESDCFEQAVYSDPEVRDCLGGYVLARLPTTANFKASGEESALLDHAAFAEMKHRPGIAMIDLSEPSSPHYGYVVSVFPFGRSRLVNRGHLGVLLRLPRGSLTQRTLIFAVRTHPDGPISANGEFHHLLAAESESHSLHQAEITTQGHHQWESRFHHINARLPEGMIAQEVCAESWPGQDLLEAAIDCVDSWRQSSGHWSAVSGEQALFAYDMKRGRNGVWYATGLFARRR